MKVLIRVVLIVTLGLIVRTAVSALGETTTHDDAAASPGSCQVTHENGEYGDALRTVTVCHSIPISVSNR